MHAATDSAVDRKALLILGMHRSGTSALTRLVNLMGADLGDGLLPAREDNARGFWERRDVMEINEKLLSQLGRSWDDTTDLDAGWLSGGAASSALGSMIHSIQVSFSSSPLWALKDPRICRLLPLWLNAITASQTKASAVLICRHPSEVAASLLKRDGLPRDVGTLLWVQHVLDAERDSRSLPRALVTYDEVIDDWRGCLARIGEQAEISWPVSFEDAAQGVELFISSGERHHQDRIAASGRLEVLALQMYEACGDIASGNSSAWSRFDDFRCEYERSKELLAGALRRYKQLWADSEQDKTAALSRAENEKIDALSYFQAHIIKQDSAINSLKDEALELAKQKDVMARELLEVEHKKVAGLQETAARSVRARDLVAGFDRIAMRLSELADASAQRGARTSVVDDAVEASKDLALLDVELRSLELLIVRCEQEVESLSQNLNRRSWLMRKFISPSKALSN